MCLKLNWYSQGNKSGKLLADQYKGKLTQNKIPYMTDSKGNRLTNLLDIATCFCDFYAALYNLNSTKPSNQPTNYTGPDCYSFPTLHDPRNSCT